MSRIAAVHATIQQRERDARKRTIDLPLDIGGATRVGLLDKVDRSSGKTGCG